MFFEYDVIDFAVSCWCCYLANKTNRSWS